MNGHSLDEKEMKAKYTKQSKIQEGSLEKEVNIKGTMKMSERSDGKHEDKGGSMKSKEYGL